MKTIQEIQAIRDKMMVHLENRVVGGKKNEKAKERAHILVCGGTGCTSGHSKDIYSEFVEVLKEKGLSDEIKLIMTGCFGLCAKGPIVSRRHFLSARKARRRSRNRRTAHHRRRICRQTAGLRARRERSSHIF